MLACVSVGTRVYLPPFCARTAQRTCARCATRTSRIGNVRHNDCCCCCCYWFVDDNDADGEGAAVRARTPHKPCFRFSLNVPAPAHTLAAKLGAQRKRLAHTFSCARREYCRSHMPKHTYKHSHARQHISCRFPREIRREIYTRLCIIRSRVYGINGRRGGTPYAKK